MGQIVIFSKSRCPHCVEAKAILGRLDIPFSEIDIEEDLQNSMLMSYASKRHTVPQIFFNDRHIGGARELKQLDSDHIRQLAKDALAEEHMPEFLTASYSQEQLLDAVIPIKDYLDPYLPKDFVNLPEYKAIRLWYSQMFGFLCNCYDQMTLKPEPMALFMPVLSSMMVLVEKQVGKHFGLACLATAYAADCAYCAAHGADLSMKYAGQSDQQIKQLYDYLNGDTSLESLPFSDELKVIVQLASGMSTQRITDQDMTLARSVYGVGQLRDLCESVAGMGGIMGFLNRWNDLIGVEIEASIKRSIDNSALSEQWDWGTHDTEDDENRHIFRDPDAKIEPPTESQFKGLVDKVRDDVFTETDPLISKYLQYDDTLLPAWIAILPSEDTTRSVSAFYHACFNAGELSSELKHLAAYALALGAGHPEMAAEEKRIAESLCRNRDTFASRMTAVEKMALDGQEPGDSLDDAEITAIKLARAAQRFPHVVRGELVSDLAKQFTPAQIVELVMALAVIGIGQRWVGISRPLHNYLHQREA